MKMRGLSDAEAERLEDEGVGVPDKHFRAHGGTLYHVDPDFIERLAPGEDVADAIEARLETVPCRRREEPFAGTRVRRTLPSLSSCRQNLCRTKPLLIQAVSGGPQPVLSGSS